MYIGRWIQELAAAGPGGWLFLFLIFIAVAGVFASQAFEKDWL